MTMQKHANFASGSIVMIDEPVIIWQVFTDGDSMARQLGISETLTSVIMSGKDVIARRCDVSYPWGLSCFCFQYIVNGCTIARLWQRCADSMTTVLYFPLSVMRLNNRVWVEKINVLILILISYRMILSFYQTLLNFAPKLLIDNVLSYHWFRRWLEKAMTSNLTHSINATMWYAAIGMQQDKLINLSSSHQHVKLIEVKWRINASGN